MFYGITDLTAFIVGTLLIVILPGPNSLYVMSVASQQGIRMGYRGACGIFAGDTILMVLAAAGMASVLRTHPALFLAMKCAGAAYLAYLGCLLIRAAWRKLEGKQATQSLIAIKPAHHQPFKVALSISLLNPKAILFFVSFFIQFVSPDYAHPALSFAILGLIVQTCSFIYLSCLIFLSQSLANAFHRHILLGAIGMASIGLMFIGFGFNLALASMR